jgi:stage II sporulation protein D (peptidoglycan lytic transglycosylase)
MRHIALILLAMLPLSCASNDPAAPSAPGDGSVPQLRVRLRSVAQARENRVRARGAWRLVDLATDASVDSGVNLDRMIPTAGGRLHGALRLLPEARVFNVGDRVYEGTLLLRPRQGGVDLIVETDLEAYLPGVLAREMGAGFPPAALRAQAVAARTYALFRTATAPTGRSFDVADDQTDQVYGGTPSGAFGPVFAAVAATRGMVLFHLGRPLPAYFHSTCGGHTAAVEDVFGGPPIPPLAGGPCRYCTASAHYRWECRLPLTEASRRLGCGSTLRDIAVGRTDRAGRAVTFRLTTTSVFERPAQDVRMALGATELRSNFIEWIKVVGPDLRCNGRGWGHGVGLCQMGARGMALSGASASDILRQYYPGADLFRLY